MESVAAVAGSATVRIAAKVALPSPFAAVLAEKSSAPTVLPWVRQLSAILLTLAGRMPNWAEGCNGCPGGAGTTPGSAAMGLRGFDVGSGGPAVGVGVGPGGGGIATSPEIVPAR